MKKVAIMQPYLFPYVGYFQLISAVDTFVVYDDVQWMKGGWINRNRILSAGRPDWVTLSVKKDSVGTNICTREFSDKFEDEKRHIVEKMRVAYARAPYFEPTLDLVGRSFASTQTRAHLFLTGVLREFCAYLGITTEIVLSSELAKTDGLRGEDRVLDICRTLGASQYVNAIGGRDLYSREAFSEHGLELSFVQTEPIEYRQFGDPFVRDLSIVDTLMFNSVEQVQGILNRFELV
jgi:WbqC-like protein family